MALAVPNFSAGRDPATIAAITDAFAAGAELLDRHSDAAHNRSVLNLAAPGAELVDALVAGAYTCVVLIDMRAHAGEHPCVGALDVCPLVWIDEGAREEAVALARALAPALAELGLPVFLYGELAATRERRERAFFRRGGLVALSQRMADGELAPDFGPPRPHPNAGATLVTARAPLAAFNVELDTADMKVARAIAAQLREAGGGPPGVRAIAVDLGGRAQVSTNIHDPIAVPAGNVIERVRELAAAHGVRPVSAEVVGLISQAALGDLPEDVPLRGFDPELQLLERRLGAAGR
jgi:glutamate formiminotransferase / 5-formyltetrahydrofolate cyclo-ligase